jgi:DNA (cytosine-5)-methyltransferase 1
MIGKRALDDPRNALLGEFARLVIEMQPRYFVMENVAGLTIGNHRQLLDEVVAIMADAGYNMVLPYRVLQAADFGTPQSRRRLILLGSRSDVPAAGYPVPQYTPRTISGKAPVSQRLPLGPSVSHALVDLPDADRYQALLDGDQSRAEFGQPSEYSAPLRGLVRQDDDFSRLRRFDGSLLTSSARTVHTDKSISRFTSTIPGTTEPVSRFLRLHPDGIANTLRAGTASDRGAYTAPRPIHPWLPRVITVREAARLHGYPDWFRFHVTKWNGFRQIGNSVPARLAHAVARSLLIADNLVPAPGLQIEPGNTRLLEFTASQAEQYFGITERVIPQRHRKVG